ncbi:PLD nuclease N-terminal domain-containing protein [Agromyces ramosus]|uniref:Cardiolipin synthase N-terminal domain-containing protein n=1 Tax=Agromyces ramosus TaxID=33879 RepID=A0ABU0RAD1_9MICO|nr:PLD nuclease N-terminal domain-containing protein [Agromyces ramosus]MDQ0895035.1 hypothetical protein [Agromyces ramosus]
MIAVFPVMLVLAMLFALIDIIMRDEGQVRHLPKFGWILLVVFLPLIGTVLWFVLGREYGAASSGEGIGSLMARRSPPASQYRPPAPEVSSTEQQLAELDREIEYYQRRAELERLKREVDGDPA